MEEGDDRKDTSKQVMDIKTTGSTWRQDGGNSMAWRGRLKRFK